jgi:hypothetical protein
MGHGVGMSREIRPGEGMMPRFRFTIARWMAATAVLGVNIGLVRWMVAERELFDFGFFLVFVLQLGLWRYLSTRGRRRRFWLGFEVSGLAATLALSILLESEIDLDNWYTGAASDLAYLCLPARVDDWLMQHWDGFLAILHFLPELLAATLGGLLAACLFKVSKVRVDTTRPAPAVEASSA